MLRTLREAAQAYRDLAEADPAAHLYGQVEVEGDYADLLGWLGRTGEALTMMRNMVAVAHGHAEAEPEIFGPALTAALTRLARRLPGAHERIVDSVRPSPPAMSSQFASPTGILRISRAFPTS